MPRIASTLTSLLSLSLSSQLVLSTPVPAAAAAPPNVPSESDARGLLTDLKVAPQGPQDGYDRDLFPHWSEVDGNCNTRETVLGRDGTDIEVGSDCYPESGSWTSVYDGQKWTKASDLDIDHVVPLSNAWKSGAADWTTEQREKFANDLENPQLLAVTDDVNQEKGDQGPEDWQPPLESYHCVYARMWIKVKSVYELTITEAEKGALDDMLGSC